MPIVHKKNISPHFSISGWLITESLNELCKLLNNKEIELFIKNSTSSEIKQKQRIVIRLLLNDIYPNSTYNYDSFGKPFLNNAVEISVAHAENYAVVAVNTQKKCGIDIEKIGEKVNKIKHKFLNENELKVADTSEKLTKYWCAKEALYKLYGQKELVFKEQLLIEHVTENNFKGSIIIGHHTEFHELLVEKIEDYILVYTI